ncbi:hypothetical protein [Burkholderia ubonensis]|uniref:hypothetical protein n=1 Tax=Burkholderia ubonensis TaxID=101571 RepID=UPI000AEDF121|nr:hypothetical protein [Burkholderia ubonensis]
MNRVDAAPGAPAPERNGVAGSHRLPCTRRRAHAGFRRRHRAQAIRTPMRAAACAIVRR